MWEYLFPHTNHSAGSNPHVASPLSNNSSPVLWLGHRADPRGQGSGQLLGLDNSQSATWSKSATRSGDCPWQPPLPRPNKHGRGRGLWVNLRGRSAHMCANTYTRSVCTDCPKGCNSLCPSVTPNSPSPSTPCVWLTVGGGEGRERSGVCVCLCVWEVGGFRWRESFVFGLVFHRADLLFVGSNPLHVVMWDRDGAWAGNSFLSFSLHVWIN